MFNISTMNNSELEACVNEYLFRLYDTVPADYREQMTLSVNLGQYWKSDQPTIRHSVSLKGTTLTGGSVSTMLAGVLASLNIAAVSPPIQRALPAPPAEEAFPEAEFEEVGQ